MRKEEACKALMATRVMGRTCKVQVKCRVSWKVFWKDCRFVSGAVMATPLSLLYTYTH